MIYKDYFKNLIGGVIVALFTFVLYKLILISYGNEDLEFFTLIKRYQTILFPIVMLGFGVLIPKLLVKKTINDKTVKSLVIVSTLFFLGLMLFCYYFNITWFYACLYTFPVMLSTFIFSIYRGGMLFQQGINSNYIFLIALPLCSYILTTNLISFLFLYCIASSVLFIFFFKNILESDFLKNTVDYNLINIIFNGLQRVPGDVISQFVLLFPLYFLNENIYNVGEYALAISIVVAFSIPIKPLGTVLLVYLSKADFNKNKIMKSLIFYIFISMLFTVIFLGLIKYINIFYFDTPSFLLVLNNLTPMVFFTTIYIFLRSYVDSLYASALLSYINIFIVAIYCILIFLQVDSISGLNISYGLGVLIVFLSIIYKVKQKNE